MLVKSTKLFVSFLLLTLLSITTFSQQSICGTVGESFINTGGSTGGFTGDFGLGSSGGDGYLQRSGVIARGLYTLTTPTFQLRGNATSLGYGFVLRGSERVARVEAALVYRSTLNGEITTVLVDEFVPAYAPSLSAAVCRAVGLDELQGFPVGGSYRFRFEITPVTGAGGANQNVTFDDFRTNGTRAQAPLPVTFIGIEARKLSAGVQLTWKIAGEENVVRYEVERSGDGRSFSTVHAVERNGKDTYTYLDPSPLATGFYRVRNVDSDGKFKYSTIVRVAGGTSTVVVRAFPLPAQNQLTLQHPALGEGALISLSTTDGRVVKSLKPGASSLQTTLELSSLQKGLYLLRFTTQTGETQTLKITKQ